MCFAVCCWERADLLALVCGVCCEFVTFPLVSWVRCGTWLYRFLIFAPLLTLKNGIGNTYLKLLFPWNDLKCKMILRNSLIIYMQTTNINLKITEQSDQHHRYCPQANIYLFFLLRCCFNDWVTQSCLQWTLSITFRITQTYKDSEVIICFGTKFKSYSYCSGFSLRHCHKLFVE